MAILRVGRVGIKPVILNESEERAI
jgi:hypothetical protein